MTGEFWIGRAMKVNDADWERLNAYADGELPEEEASVFARRLEHDAELREELARIRSMKKELAALAPALAEISEAEVRRPRRPWPAATAAGIAAAVGLVLWLGLPQPEAPALDTVSGLHAEFSATEDPGGGEASAAGALYALDLTVSNLRHVGTREVGGATGHHYRGPNGCRLTLIVGSLPLGQAPGPLVREWATPGQRFTLIADGMDPDRFHAIATYAEAETRRTGETEELRVAVAERTQSARPCA